MMTFTHTPLHNMLCGESDPTKYVCTFKYRGGIDTMTYIHRTLTILIATFILLIGVAVINQPVHAEADQFRYIQVGLNEEEIELLFESSIVYQDITYYGVRQSADVWRFLINEDVVEDTLIDQITLYDASGVPYSLANGSTNWV